jgi:hypothetical protein
VEQTWQALYAMFVERSKFGLNELLDPAELCLDDADQLRICGDRIDTGAAQDHDHLLEFRNIRAAGCQISFNDAPCGAAQCGDYGYTTHSRSANGDYGLPARENRLFKISQSYACDYTEVDRIRAGDLLNRRHIANPTSERNGA